MSKTAVITGGAGAIGQAVAKKLSEAGFSPLTVDRVPAATGHVGRHIDGPIEDPATWQIVRDTVVSNSNPVGVIVHTAYTLDRSPHASMTPDSWAHQIAVNLSSVHTMFHALGTDTVTDPLKVVFISSVHSHIGVPGHSAYAASKGGLNALSRQLSVEWGPAARVNSIVLGPVLTPVWKDASPEDVATAASQTALGRMGSPEDVANVVGFLASDQSDFLTGTEIVLDGGFLAVRETR